MDKQEDTGAAQVADLFAKQLNSHGYGFQHRVIREAESLQQRGKSPWYFEAAEVPVSVGDDHTRIDIVFKRQSGPPFYLLAECKRANPALSNWCFARAPYVHRRRAEIEPIILERLDKPEKWEPVEYKSAAFPRSIMHEAVHIALDVATQQPGGTHDSGRGAIEKAATQIMRGLNGMVNLLPQHPEFFAKRHAIAFLPVIFTTAKLWVSDVDLGKSDLLTGKVDITRAGFRNVPWLSYQYHLSPGVKHSFWQGNGPSDFPALLDLDFIRTIPIVSASGIATFLGWTYNLDIGI